MIKITGSRVGSAKTILYVRKGVFSREANIHTVMYRPTGVFVRCWPTPVMRFTYQTKFVAKGGVGAALISLFTSPKPRGVSHRCLLVSACLLADKMVQGIRT